ncbi:MAG: VanW family protein [Clostridiales bacterium]|nr:VanW family protein [Clostridiales bacterium]
MVLDQDLTQIERDRKLELLDEGIKGASPEDAENEDLGIDISGESKSGQISSLPWEGEPEFSEAKKMNKTGVLMAAYRTVLVDPLPGEEYNVHLAAELISGRVIASGSVFSQNREIGPYDKSKGFREGPTYAGAKLITTIGGGVCKISSTLYNVAVLSDLEIVQRYNHSMPVPYVPYGQDATVAYGGRDFQFKNDTPYPIMIWARGIGNNLYVAFYGQEKPPKVQWEHEISNVQKAPVIYKGNPGLASWEKKIIIEGMDGATVKSKVVVTKPDGTVETKDMGVSRYQPMPYIVERGR